jgi:hypothetical protein
MKYIWRVVYLGYYFKKLNKSLLKKFIQYLKQTKQMNEVSIWLNVFYHSIKYNISILEYFQFRFFEKNENDKITWAGTGHMYEYQLKMNPPGAREILDDKRQFYHQYKEFFVHKVGDLDSLVNEPNLAKEILATPSGKLVFKVADGKCGADVEIRKCEEFDEHSLINYLKESTFDLVEEFIIQHPEINNLSPSAVNTVRIFTQLTAKNEVEILGCRQRISVNSKVDNMAAGNLAAPIDELTGIINGPGVYSDITKSDETIHPITLVKIVGFKVPYWEQTMDMVKRAALKHPQNRSIGWDIVITEKGPGLIEGNHDWCKLLWQLPAKRGLKSLLKLS